MNYKFGPKNNWRRWAWNRIVDALAVLEKDPKDAVVLYFAGERDLDRTVALSKGFRPHNLIAVEHHWRVTKKLRKSGTITANGDVLDFIHDGVLRGLSIDVLFADFCSGFSRVPRMLAKTIPGIHSMAESVVAINLMRGRDLVKSGDDSDSYLNEAMVGRHRGSCFHALAWAGFWGWLSEWRKVFLVGGVNHDDLAMKFKKQFESGHHESYRSISGQTFDSSVFVNPSIFHYEEWARWTKCAEGILSVITSDYDNWIAEETDPSIRKIMTKEWRQKSIEECFRDVVSSEGFKSAFSTLKECGDSFMSYLGSLKQKKDGGRNQFNRQFAAIKATRTRIANQFRISLN